MNDNLTQKKDEIAQVFMKIFQEYGMRKIIINDVAKELGMSKKTIYKYFTGGNPEAFFLLKKKKN
jgi:AcrR family transcriptional regulator